MQVFDKSGHPSFRCSSPFSRGVLESIGVGGSSSHYTADPNSAEMLLKTIVSINQFSTCRAVMIWCIGRREVQHVNPNENLNISQNYGGESHEGTNPLICSIQHCESDCALLVIKIPHGNF